MRHHASCQTAQPHQVKPGAGSLTVPHLPLLGLEVCSVLQCPDDYVSLANNQPFQFLKHLSSKRQGKMSHATLVGCASTRGSTIRTCSSDEHACLVATCSSFLPAETLCQVVVLCQKLEHGVQLATACLDTFVGASQHFHGAELQGLTATFNARLVRYPACLQQPGRVVVCS